uniref:Uncharacterized protein n=1 Tax=viral metagenome TaxID=1070528 RepID=A0A6H2A3H2_9ZZZZ
MTVIGSCGHELESVEGYSIVTADVREGNPCLSYGYVCKKCYNWYEKKRLLIRNVKLWEKRHWGKISEVKDERS